MDPHAERTAELMDDWLQSIVLWWDDDGVAGVLAGPGAGPLPAGADVVHVLTSQDPHGVEQPPARNRQLLADLLHRLRHDPPVPGLRWWPATGATVDLGHHEQGVAVVGMTRDQASRWGAELDQLAIYEMTPDRCRVVTCPGAEVDEEVPRRWGGDRNPIPEEVIAAWWSTYAELADRAP